MSAKTKIKIELEKNYHPIKFALNRAVFHKELSSEKADKGIAEYDSLIANFLAVVEALRHIVEYGNFECEQRCKDWLPYKKHSPECPREYILTAEEALSKLEQ